METHLRGRRALVTAASKGLGFACARALLREGCRVIISSSDADHLEAAAKELRNDGDVNWVVADLSKTADCEHLVDAATSQLGGLDVLVTNTRGPVVGPIEDLDASTWLHAVHLVLISAVLLAKLSLPALREGPGGSIVHLTSIAAREPVDRLVLSNALRPAVVGFGKTLANEAAPKVRVNSVLTGRILTDRIRELEPNEADRRGIAKIPLGRYGEPDELAAAVVFLAGDCSSFITGATLTVDGGECRSA